MVTSHQVLHSELGREGLMGCDTLNAIPYTARREGDVPVLPAWAITSQNPNQHTHFNSKEFKLPTTTTLTEEFNRHKIQKPKKLFLWLLIALRESTINSWWNSVLPEEDRGRS